MPLSFNLSILSQFSLSLSIVYLFHTLLLFFFLSLFLSLNLAFYFLYPFLNFHFHPPSLFLSQFCLNYLFLCLFHYQLYTCHYWIQNVILFISNRRKKQMYGTSNFSSLCTKLKANIHITLLIPKPTVKTNSELCYSSSLCELKT